MGSKIPIESPFEAGFSIPLDWNLFLFDVLKTGEPFMELAVEAHVQ
jgi:hypothetical protein